MACNRVQARAVTAWTFARFLFLDPFRLALSREFIFQNRIAILAFSRLQILIPDFSKSTAFLARAVRRIKRKQSRIELFKCAAAAGTTHFRAHNREPIPRVEQVRRAAPDLKRAAHKIARFQNSLRIDCADNDIDSVFLETLELPKLRQGNERSIDIKRVETLTLCPARNVAVKTFARFHQRREHIERAALRRRFDLLHNRGDTLFFDRQIALRAKLRSRFREEQPEKMINFRHRRNGRFSAAASDALLNRDARRQTGDKIDIGLFELLDKLPGIRRHAVEETSLSFRKQNVERERRLPRAAQAGDDDHLIARNLETDIFKIVLARAIDGDRTVVSVREELRRRFCRARQLFTVILSGVEGSRCITFKISQRDPSISLRFARDDSKARALARPPKHALEKSSGVRIVDLSDLCRRPNCDNFATFIPRFRAKIDNPVRAFDHFQIVLNHDDRMTAADESLKKSQQHRDVVEMQSRRRLVENKKVTAR